MIRDKVIKVCGMRDADNIRQISLLKPDYMGFIFWEHTPRTAIGMPASNISLLPSTTRPVGVLVNETVESILSTCTTYGINTVQLHGSETPDMCLQLRSHGLHVWKAFGIDDGFDFSSLRDYEHTVEMLVLDTKTPKCGGSGRRFDWSILDRYDLDIPYLLSGGISPDSANDVLAALSKPHFAGIDLNSRFESAPGIKDSEKLTNFANSLKR